MDPSRGTLSLPQSLNRYAYVTNNPVNAVDPLGLFPFINLPPICPVVDGVAMCGSLGEVSVSAGGNGGTLLGGGGGSGSEGMVAVGGPNAENEEIPGSPDLWDEFLKPINGELETQGPKQMRTDRTEGYDRNV